jgi:hypothetical protein
VGLLLYNVDTPDPSVAARCNVGGFHPPMESEDDDYVSYSQLSSQLLEQGYTCYHCSKGMTIARCPTCTYGVDFICAECYEG